MTEQAYLIRNPAARVCLACGAASVHVKGQVVTRPADAWSWPGAASEHLKANDRGRRMLS